LIRPHLTFIRKGFAAVTAVGASNPYVEDAPESIQLASPLLLDCLRFFAARVPLKHLMHELRRLSQISNILRTM
jgi:hypothetical protein